jgi:hypothetical protein
MPSTGIEAAQVIILIDKALRLATTEPQRSGVSGRVQRR